MSDRPSVLATPLIALVRLYQCTLAHVLGGQCRFHPTCSTYSLEALRTHGALRGSWLTLRRLAKCHPWGPMGEDLVPTKEGKRSPRQVEEGAHQPTKAPSPKS